MRELKNNELYMIKGGGSISASFLNGIARSISTIVDLGRSLGSAIRRLINGTLCPI